MFVKARIFCGFREFFETLPQAGSYELLAKQRGKQASRHYVKFKVYIITDSINRTPIFG